MPGPVLRFLHLWVLCGFVLAQPLLDLLAKNPTFLVVHGLEPLDLVLLATAFVLAPPVVLLVLEILASGLKSGAGDALHLLLVLGLASAFAVLVVGRLTGASEFLVIPVGLSLGAVGARSYRRREGVRSYLTILSPAPVVFAAIFLVRTWSTVAPVPVAAPEPAPADREAPAVVAANPPPRSGAPSGTPVVLVIFDALPLVSLLDRDYRIDPVLYPHFAELAAEATWYRNATTLWGGSTQSVTSILTGRIGGVDSVPTAASEPRSLFSLLAPTHEIRAVERISRMAPSAVPERRPDEEEPAAASEPRPAPPADVARDLAVVYLHLLLPGRLRDHLPSLDQRWRDFRRQEAVNRRLEGDLLLPDDRADRFRSFLGLIDAARGDRFYFGHFLLPHIPLRYMPSGKLYGMRPSMPERRPSEAWRSNRQFALQFYQRHLLQVRFVDRLLGDLVARLRELDLFDRCLLVVLSDHGASYWPGENRREPDKTAYPEDILRATLLIKAPFQETGRVDDSDVQLIDVLPTVAELLEIRLPWPVDGRPATAPRRPDESPRRKVVRGYFGDPVVLAPDMSFHLPSVARKLELFGSDGDSARLFRVGPRRDLIGISVGAQGTSRCTVRFEQAEELSRYDPRGRYIPSRITGDLSCPEQPRRSVELGIEVNDVLWAVVEVALDARGRGRFGAVVAESSLVAGRNRVRFLLVTGGDPATPSLATVPIEP